MKVLALLCCLGAMACGSRSVASDDPTGEPTSNPTSNEPAQTQPKVAPVIVMSLEFDEAVGNPPTTRITLVETNQNGASTRHDLGVFEGECKDATQDVRKTDPQVFLAFHCQPSGEQRGVLVHIMARSSTLILLRAWLGSSKPSFDDFDQIGELPPFPAGIPLKSEYDL